MRKSRRFDRARPSLSAGRSTPSPSGRDAFHIKPRKIETPTGAVDAFHIKSHHAIEAPPASSRLGAAAFTARAIRRPARDRRVQRRAAGTRLSEKPHERAPHLRSAPMRDTCGPRFRRISPTPDRAARRAARRTAGFDAVRRRWVGHRVGQPSIGAPSWHLVPSDAHRDAAF